MNKTQTIITISIMVLVVILACVGAFFGANLGFQSKVDKYEKEIKVLTNKNAEIKSSKDSIGYIPEDFVKAFMNEVKTGNTANAKLYLSSKIQDMDVKNTLKLGDDIAGLIIGVSESTATSSEATVKMNFQVDTEQAARTFSLVKESENWKISGIAAE